MFRERLVAIGLLASAALMGGLSVASDVSAQEVIDLDAEAEASGEGKGKGSGAVDIDLDEGAPPDQEPVSAGQMTEQAAAAKRLFDKERWPEAALALYRVVTGETGDDAGKIGRASWRERV